MYTFYYLNITIVKYINAFKLIHQYITKTELIALHLALFLFFFDSSTRLKIDLRAHFCSWLYNQKSCFEFYRDIKKWITRLVNTQNSTIFERITRFQIECIVFDLKNSFVLSQEKLNLFFIVINVYYFNSQIYFRSTKKSSKRKTFYFIFIIKLFFIYSNENSYPELFLNIVLAFW